MLKFASKILLSLIVIVSPITSFAWNAVGHTLVAQIAYNNLTPSVKAKVDQLVATMHNDYSGITQFSDLGPWMDQLRSQKIESYTHWHYINMAFSADGTSVAGAKQDTDNAVWAIKLMLPVIANDKANVHERARFLAFLVHVVGDMHQPLHAVTRVAAAHPTGDEGGNGYHIQYQAKGINVDNLHSLWDQCMGVYSVSTSQSNIDPLVNTITTLYPKSYFSNDVVNDVKPEDWANEDVQVAQSTVYNTPEGKTPSDAYIAAGKQLAEQRTALAGYRLAAMLNSLLG